MKKVCLSRLINTGLVLSVFLTAFVFASGVPVTAAPNAQQTIKQKNKFRNKSSKKRYAVKKFRAKSKRKKLASRFPSPRAENEFESDAERREDWFMSKRMYPFAELPAEARRQAWLSRPADASGLDETGRTTNVEWQSIGPKPTTSYFPGNWGLTSGRINAIAVAPSNPELVLIGAATGGVWRSTDGGINFAPTSDNQVDLAVGSIAFAPSDNSIVYAGMGDKASGLSRHAACSNQPTADKPGRASTTQLCRRPVRTSKIEVDPTIRIAFMSLNIRVVMKAESICSSGFWYSMTAALIGHRTLTAGA